MIDQNNCIRTNWLFSKPAQKTAIDLVKFGRTNKTQASRARGDRLHVSANCSLIIQRVTAADVGTYHCQQVFNQTGKETTYSAFLSLVNLTAEEDDDEVTLSCSVLSNDPCSYSLKWLLRGQDIDKDNKALETEESNCAAKVTFQTSHYVYEPGYYNSLQCEVTEAGAKRKQMFVFGSRSSGRVNQQSEDNGKEKSNAWWWSFLVVGVSLVACLFAAWLLIKRRRIKGKRTHLDENLDETDAAISYATIILTKTNNQVRGSDTAVTYSAVKVGASPHPSDHYASIR
ncbi:PREDICTED: uncharacterized protein LOC107103599 [Cyprinodon variegatus]|uniref:uncharacterized protein LOC107103599 n=1 Tax=Cyprinodon variegatus TaxID=28743 RepID=UPI000742A4E9|nr:PREDICTED: uncharacterized protein LOC107103599 [Cyprinodon variegatus]